VTEDVETPRHPAPQAGRVPLHESFFGLFGGPLAWFAQLCFGFALASQPCFVDGDRSWRPSAGSQWALPAMWGAMGAAILSALAALPDKLREAFILHEVEELKVEEVAQVLRVPTGTVKARLIYARRKLRALHQDGSEVTNHEPKEAIV